MGSGNIVNSVILFFWRASLTKIFVSPGLGPNLYFCLDDLAEAGYQA